MQAGNHSQQDRVSMDSYELYLMRIGSWLEDLEVGVNGSRFHLERIQEEVLEEAEYDFGEFPAIAGDRVDASLSFDIDDLVCGPLPDGTVKKPGRKALDLGPRRSLDSDVPLEESILNLKGGGTGCPKNVEIVKKMKHLGLVGVAAVGVLAFVFRH